MKNIKKIFSNLSHILNRPQKVLGVLVFIAICIGSVFECLGVSIIIPVITAILTPEKIREYSFIRENNYFQSISDTALILFIIFGVIVVYLVKNLFFIFLSWFRIKFACKIEREISIKMMQSYMSRGYQFFLDTTYGELNRGVTGDPASIYTVIYAGFRWASDVMTIVFLSALMFVTDWSLALSMVIVSLICVLVIYFGFHTSMMRIGKKLRRYSALVSQDIMQAFQGIKEVLVLHKQNHFVENFEINKNEMQKLDCKRTLGAESPTYIIESFFVTGLMGIIAIKLSFGTENTVEFIGTLATFALAAFRILPSLGRISVSLNQIMGHLPSVEAVYHDICEAERFSNLHPEVKVLSERKASLISKGYFISGNSNKEKCKAYFFEKQLKLQNISFRYANTKKYILENLNLTIDKGQSIGLIGASGAGKSTLVDILLGLLLPEKGAVYIDDTTISTDPIAWSKTIGYVPQTVFLSSESILSNVAFGEKKEEIDEKSVWNALEMAELGDFVRQLPQNVFTEVGDRGVRLSGGQRQRIAIARALYHNPQIMVLDEATSALDNETEKAIMSAIKVLQGKVTLIIVAHRLSTVKDCNVIYEVSDGKLIERSKEEIF